MLYYHPTVIILASVILMIIARKTTYIFGGLALSAPLLALLALLRLEPETIDLFAIKLIIEVQPSWQLLGQGFLAVLWANNCYSLSRSKYKELIYGNIYAAFAFLCLFAGDFISVFVGLELMLIASSAIIFIGAKRNSLRQAKKYFITHLLSSNFILIGVGHIFMVTGGTEILNAAKLIADVNYNQSIIYLMLFGMLINIAIFPFSGWMVKYYPSASPAGFLYLISFTTKISIILLLKIFAGLEILSYLGLIMGLYAGFKLLFEENLQALLCYLSIIAMSLMLLGIAQDANIAMQAVTGYLLLHILYKALLSISVACLIEQAKIFTTNQLGRLQHPLILVGLLVATASMLSLPFSMSLVFKHTIAHYYYEHFIYHLISLISILMVLGLPIREFLSGAKIKMQLNLLTIAALVWLIMALLLINFAPYNLTIWPYYDYVLPADSPNYWKQMVLVTLPMIASYILVRPRYNTAPINLTEWLTESLYVIYCYWLKKQKYLEYQLTQWSIQRVNLPKLATYFRWHNQRSAVLILLILLVMLFLEILW